MLHVSATGAASPCEDWSPLIAVRVPVLFNKCSVRPRSPPIRIVLPAVLCRSCSALWNVHLHHLSLTGRHAMCRLIDVWICLRRGDCLSHGSVRQNMCEQKWGHLGRMRNCEEKQEEKEEEEKLMIEWRDRVFRRIPVPPACVVCLFYRARVFACVCVFACIPECIPVCIAVCEGETVRSFSFVPHLRFPSQVKQPGRMWQVHRCGLTGLICRPYRLHGTIGCIYTLRSDWGALKHTIVFSPQRGQCVFGFDDLQSFSVLFGHIKHLAGQWLLNQSTNQRTGCPTDVREGRPFFFLIKF